MPRKPLCQEQVPRRPVHVGDAAVPCELHSAGGWPPHLGASGLVTAVSAACGDDNPTAVGMGDVVEAKEVPRTPTNQRASDLVEHGFDLDVARRESRRDVQESIADSFGLEMSGGPRNEFGQRDFLWGLTDVHGEALSGGDSSSGYHMPTERVGSARAGVQHARIRKRRDISSSLGCV